MFLLIILLRSGCLQVLESKRTELVVMVMWHVKDSNLYSSGQVSQSKGHGDVDLNEFNLLNSPGEDGPSS